MYWCPFRLSPLFRAMADAASTNTMVYAPHLGQICIGSLGLLFQKVKLRKKNDLHVFLFPVFAQNS